ncbi:hypothetical protein QLX08_006981 [Tetragonisca angustula]|uniref:Uncharacterized protein n=1 Tax=Tetragonisca angustula TaxID=166442 RepID=A0AAW0ZRS5_9HYME
MIDILVNILPISEDISPFSNFESKDDKFPSQCIQRPPDDSNEASTSSLYKGEQADASLLFTTVGAVIFTTVECSVGERPGVSCEQEREKKGG